MAESPAFIDESDSERGAGGKQVASTNGKSSYSAQMIVQEVSMTYTGLRGASPPPSRTTHVDVTRPIRVDTNLALPSPRSRSNTHGSLRDYLEAYDRRVVSDSETVDRVSHSGRHETEFPVRIAYSGSPLSPPVYSVPIQRHSAASTRRLGSSLGSLITETTEQHYSAFSARRSEMEASPTNVKALTGQFERTAREQRAGAQRTQTKAKVSPTQVVVVKPVHKSPTYSDSERSYDDQDRVRRVERAVFSPPNERSVLTTTVVDIVPPNYGRRSATPQQIFHETYQVQEEYHTIKTYTPAKPSPPIGGYVEKSMHVREGSRDSGIREHSRDDMQFSRSGSSADSRILSPVQTVVEKFETHREESTRERRPPPDPLVEKIQREIIMQSRTSSTIRDDEDRLRREELQREEERRRQEELRAQAEQRRREATQRTTTIIEEEHVEEIRIRRTRQQERRQEEEALRRRDAEEREHRLREEELRRRDEEIRIQEEMRYREELEIIERRERARKEHAEKQRREHEERIESERLEIIRIENERIRKEREDLEIRRREIEEAERLRRVEELERKQREEDETQRRRRREEELERRRKEEEEEREEELERERERRRKGEEEQERRRMAEIEQLRMLEEERERRRKEAEEREKELEREREQRRKEDEERERRRMEEIEQLRQLEEERVKRRKEAEEEERRRREQEERERAWRVEEAEKARQRREEEEKERKRREEEEREVRRQEESRRRMEEIRKQNEREEAERLRREDERRKDEERRLTEQFEIEERRRVEEQIIIERRRKAEQDRKEEEELRKEEDRTREEQRRRELERRRQEEIRIQEERTKWEERRRQEQLRIEEEKKRQMEIEKTKEKPSKPVEPAKPTKTTTSEITLDSGKMTEDYRSTISARPGFNRGASGFTSTTSSFGSPISGNRMVKIVNEVSSSTLSGMSPFGQHAASSIRDAREREKKEMSDLNDRLASYIEKVRFLEAQNRKLQNDLDLLRSRWGKDTSSIRAMYESELKEARKLIDETTRQRDDIEKEIRRLMDELAEYRRKYEGALNSREADRLKIDDLLQKLSALEAEINLLKRRINSIEEEVSRIKKDNQRMMGDLQRARQDLDQETLNRIDYQNQVQTLLEEIDFIRRVNDQEIRDLQAMASRDTTTENREYFKNELSSAIRDIRQEYDQITNTQRTDMESWYKLKVQEISTSSAKINMEQGYAKEEVKRLRVQLGDLRGKLADLEGRNSLLEKQIQELNYQLEDDQRSYESALNDRDAQIRKMREECQALMVELQMLLDTKQTLDAEIAIYRKMLEGEENRAGLRQLVEQVVKTTGLTHTDEHETLRTLKGETSSRTSFQRSAKGNVSIQEASADGKFIVLENTHRSRDEEIGGWKLKRKIDGKKEIVYTFPAHFILRPQKTVKIFARGAGTAGIDSLVHEGDDSFGTGNNVQTILFNLAGEERATHIQRSSRD